MKTIRIYVWPRYLQKLVSVGAIRRFIFNLFANQNLSRHKKAEVLPKWIVQVLRVKFRFMGCLVKTNVLVLGNIALSLSSQLTVFTKKPSAERYLVNIFSPEFSPEFTRTLTAHQNTLRKILETSQEFTRGKVLC